MCNHFPKYQPFTMCSFKCASQVTIENTDINLKTSRPNSQRWKQHNKPLSKLQSNKLLAKKSFAMHYSQTKNTSLYARKNKVMPTSLTPCPQDLVTLARFLHVKTLKTRK